MTNYFKIVAVDNHDRDEVADRLVVPYVPNNLENHLKANEFCDWLNSFSAHDGGMFHRIVKADYRLSRGMEDLI